MKPIAIFRHVPFEGPGYCATFLEAHCRRWQLIAIDDNAPVPTRADDFAGLVFMGGPMSVNDALSWIDAECRLIRDAVAADIPVLGHCLGGQLIAKALGATITRNPVKEIGWGMGQRANAADASPWLENISDPVPLFHWHGETFSIPEGATRILGTDPCANQGFVMNDRHLALQCHVEMTTEMIAEWGRHGAEEIATARAAGMVDSVQTTEAMLAAAPDWLPGMRQVADALYGRWIEGLRD